MPHPADIITEIEHTIYVDVVGGPPVVPLNRSPSHVEIFNDRDLSLLKFFAALADPQCQSLARFVDRNLTPQHLDIHLHNYYTTARRVMASGFYRHVRGQCASGPFNDACEQIGDRLPMIRDIAGRLSRLEVETEPYDDLFDEHDSSDTVFFVNLCDTSLTPEDQHMIFHKASRADGVVLFYARRVPPKEQWPVIASSRRGFVFSRHPAVLEALVRAVEENRKKHARPG